MATNFLHQFRSVLLVVLISTVGVLSVTGMLKILFLRIFFIFETLWVNCDDSTSGEKISRKNRKTLFGKNCCSAKSSAKISKEIIFLSILHTIVRVILLIEMWVFFLYKFDVSDGSYLYWTKMVRTKSKRDFGSNIFYFLDDLVLCFILIACIFCFFLLLCNICIVVSQTIF